MRKNFPFYKQPDSKDCGPTCLKIIAKHYGKTLNIQTLRNLSETTREGSNLLNISDAAESIGFKTLGVKLSVEKLHEAPLPCILHWNKNHYVVLYKVGSGKRGVGSLFARIFGISSYSKHPTSSFHHPTSSFHHRASYSISDPAFGLLEYNEEEFIKHWIGNNADATTEEGIALLVEPTPKFYSPLTPKGGIDAEDDKQLFSSPLWGWGITFSPINPLSFSLLLGY
jgi:ATP-binding cassette subfamily B protein